MGNPSFTNPISWKPFYLTLIIFLQVISDNRGAEAKRYGDPCASNSECLETLFCDVNKGVCDCPNYIDSKLVQFFDDESRTCLTSVGKACTLDKAEGLADFLCVPNAYCDKNPRGPRTLGICSCKEGYEEDYRHLCVPRRRDEQVSSRHSSADEEILRRNYPISSQAMQDLNKIGKTEKLEDDGNKHIVVDQRVLDGYVASGAGFVGIDKLILLIFVVVLERVVIL